MGKFELCDGKTCPSCGGKLSYLNDPELPNAYQCDKCWLLFEAESVPIPVQATQRFPSQVNYIVKVFYPKWQGQTYIAAESQLQDYLNTNKVDPNRIISLDSTGKPDSCTCYFTLVYY